MKGDESWKMPRTVMIKKRKPTAADLRPIALKDVSYKIMHSERESGGE